HHLAPPSFPTRRSSDLGAERDAAAAADGVPPHLRRLAARRLLHRPYARARRVPARVALDRALEPGAGNGLPRLAALLPQASRGRDRKSTRLNSSHVKIS